MPPAFGLAGFNLHTWTGFGSVPYWNAFVAVTEMLGSGVYFDARLKNLAQSPHDHPIRLMGHAGHAPCESASCRSEYHPRNDASNRGRAATRPCR